MRHLLLLSILLLALPSLGPHCADQPILRILAPEDGSALEACDVEVVVHAKGSALPATLDARLNGQPLPLTPHPFSATVFTASVPLGPMLQANNTLEVSVDGSGGGSDTQTSNFTFAADEPRARRITDPADLMSGPQADGRVGDWLLENCTARFIIQDAPQRDISNVGGFGGNLIDAELRSRPGIESFYELQPILNIETVVNAETAVIVNDGMDGNPAVVRTCGPDDLIDYINASTITDDLFGPGTFPPGANDKDLPIVGCTEYSLAAGDRHVVISTEVENLDPVDSQCLFVGDYINPSGEIEQWTREAHSVNPFGATSGVGEMFVNFGFDLFSMLGAGEAVGVDYTYMPLEFDDDTPCVPGFGTAGGASSFTESGTSAILQGVSIITTLFLQFPPAFLVPANDGSGTNKNAWNRIFAVGDGSLSNGVDLRIDLLGLGAATLSGCVTRGGVPHPGARVAIGKLMGGTIEELTSHAVADEAGCWSAQVEAPTAPADVTYGVAAAALGTPYEGGGLSPIYHEVAVSAGDGVPGIDIALPATGRVEVSVVDQDGLPVPARVGVLGNDPSPPQRTSFDIAGAVNVTTSLFFDSTSDPTPGGFTKIAYSEADGSVAFDLEPGTYDLVVSRGTEWSAVVLEDVAVGAGAPTPIAVQLAHVLDTTGFVSSDFHVHTDPSGDSGINKSNRVRSFAGEGVDNIVATDHDRHTDLNPVIAALGLTPFVHSTIGEEITSFDYGHFNAYPLGIDPDRVTGGSTDWPGAAPVGEGFADQVPPAAYPPSYTLRPDQIFDAVHDGTKLAGGLLNPSPSLAVQVNHIGSHFGPLQIDSADPPLRSQLDASELLSRRFDPATPATAMFHAFDALEVWNGHTVGAQSEFLDSRIGIWANLLNQGIKISAVYDTDTHDFNTTRQGGARSWTPASSDAPAAIDDDEIGAAVLAGKVVGGQGVYVQARLAATNAPANQADFTLGGATQITVPDGEVTLAIDVQAPMWAEYDRIEIYANAPTTATGSNGGVPVDYTATPLSVLVEGVDFARSTVAVHAVPGGDRFETQVSLPFTLTEDTWFAVVVRGTSGASTSMFPVMAASLSSGGVYALGATNALYADVDGNGLFDAPGIQLAP